MSSRRYEKSLEKEGLIKRCPVDYKAIAIQLKLGDQQEE
jgi:DNA-binding MarR family transcriptional regulator